MIELKSAETPKCCNNCARFEKCGANGYCSYESKHFNVWIDTGWHSCSMFCRSLF